MELRNLLYNYNLYSVLEFFGRFQDYTFEVSLIIETGLYIYLRKSPLVTLTKCKNAYSRLFQALKEFLNIDQIDGIRLLIHCIFCAYWYKILFAYFYRRYFNIFGVS